MIARPAVRQAGGIKALLRSIQGQVALRLVVVFLVATALGVGALLYSGTQEAALDGAPDVDALAHALLREFVFDVAWAIPLFAGATLGAGVWAVRSALRPLRATSERAAAIAPDAVGVRLPAQDLPTELVPLVAAVNRALDRLEQGFAMQRQFTADAAHELRTPLAILTAGLEALDDGPEIAKLRADAARMNRLVEQLLRVARLDAVPVDAGRVIDLGATAAATVEYLAPWAVTQGRALGFDAPAEPVQVRADPDAVADALRNLIENAVAHTPPATEVAVAVAPDGAVSVSDRGPGVAEADRARVFERFWRGRGERRAGAGLGLAIVAETARTHGGTVQVGDAPGGGAVFTLKLRPA